MQSGFVQAETGKPLGWVHGVVSRWNYGCGHIVTWKETKAVTPAHLSGIEKDDAS